MEETLMTHQTDQTDLNQRCIELMQNPNTLWHLVGIGGIGVSAVARLLLGRNQKVRGSDVRESQITLGLREEGADVHIGHSGGHLKGVDVLVASTAIPETNIELITAREKGILVVHRSHLLGALVNSYEKSVGVTGTHGKGTVSSVVTFLLSAQDLNPDFVIGGLLLNEGTNARGTGSDILVAEVDESDGSHQNTRPTHAVLNCLELDHLNYYESWDMLSDSMLHFARENARLQGFYLNVADTGVQRLLPRLVEAGVKLRSFGLETPTADLWAKDIRPLRLPDGRIGGSMTVMLGAEELGIIETRLPGRYNLSNILGGLLVSMDLGVSFEVAQRSLPEFAGLENRFTVVDTGQQLVVKDYISHPTGIRRVLEGATHFERSPVVAVFKPYRFTMVHYLQDDYRDAFHNADHVIINELYTAGEVPIPGIDTDFLCNKIRESGAQVTYVPDIQDLPDYLMENHQDSGMVLFFGGDDLFAVADRYAGMLDAS
jgi:UDP-N-acetylmuramate--alanine ligase